MAALAACGGNDDGAETGSASQSFNAGERTPLLASLAMLYPNGQLPDERLQQAQNDLNENPAVLLLTAETPKQLSQTAGIESNFIAQPFATSADFAPVQRIQNVSLYGAYFFSIYPSEVSTALSTHPNWKLEGPAFWASLATGIGLQPVHRFQNKINGSYLYTIYDTERADIVANYSATFVYEGVAWYAQQTPGTGWSPLYRFRNKTNGTYLFSAYESEKDAIVANYPDVFVLEGIGYYVRQDAPVVPPTPVPVTIGGALTGLGASKSVVLSLNGGSDLTLNSNAGFTFSGTILSGQTYAVTVKTQPSGQVCSVTNGSGTVPSSNVTNVVVSCLTSVVPPVPVTISGALTGLGASKSVVLSLNGGSDLTLNSNAGFTFSGTILSGQTYAVTVKTQPPGQVCSVTNGSGTVPTSNVTNVTVSCLNYVTVGGSVSGLGAGKSLILRLNGVQSRTFTSNIAAYSFSTPLVSGQSYGVLIEAQPVGQICSLVNGTGTAIGNVTNVNVTCVYQVKVGGTVNGLGASKTITLTLNGSTDLAVTTSSFQFPRVLTTGQLYSVVIKTQPIEQTCTLLNNTGTIASVDVTNIAVTCVNHTSVSGAVSGLNAGISPVVITLNGGSDLQLSNNSSFVFLTKVPNGQAYAVVVKTQPVGQTCSVSNGNGVASGSNITNVLVSCVNNVPTGLIISEVANSPYAISPHWFEVHNPTTTSINLSAYSFKSYSYTSSGFQGVHTFGLPNMTILPNAYALIMGNPAGIKPLNTQTVLINDIGHTPYWAYNNGFVELILNSTNATIDFVRFGNNVQAPTSPLSWVGAAVPAMTVDGVGYSIARPASSINTQDTNSAGDWISVSFTTPGGQNDVPSGAVDSDGDGIPDSAKLPGSTYAGMDLYSMGARQGKRDIFIEIDHMNSTDPGVIPRAEALQKVVDAFAAKGIALHIDAGTQFSATFSTASFNLGQGNSTVTYEQCVSFDNTVCTLNTSQLRTVYDWKLANFDLRRNNIFHYMLFGNSKNANGSSGSSGEAEISGNDSIITLGNWGLTTTAGTSLNKLINFQAGTIMHEFGHNLGLRHGGNEDVNYKPNYYSVMNYMYQLDGLALSASSIGPFQRWNGTSLCSTLNSPCGSPSQFVIDYSNGSSTVLNEASLSESVNIGRGADAGVYADWNSNLIKDAATYAKDLNFTGSNSSLNDFNDWGNLYLRFHRGWVGYSGIAPNNITASRTTPFDPVGNDQQTASNCSPPSAQWLKRVKQAH